MSKDPVTWTTTKVQGHDVMVLPDEMYTKEQYAYTNTVQAEQISNLERALRRSIEDHKRALAALKKYGRHEDGCAAVPTFQNVWEEVWSPKATCSCGFDAALKGDT